ncbi:MAG: hypothetical protein ABIQ64_02705 [Candidatus Saccharimonadales bacterium]
MTSSRRATQLRDNGDGKKGLIMIKISGRFITKVAMAVIFMPWMLAFTTAIMAPVTYLIKLPPLVFGSLQIYLAIWIIRKFRFDLLFEVVYLEATYSWKMCSLKIWLDNQDTIKQYTR